MRPTQFAIHTMRYNTQHIVLLLAETQKYEEKINQSFPF